MSAYTRVQYQGRTLNRRTLAMLEHADGLLGLDLIISQGSYNKGGVAASAGTHDGGGAVDISQRSWQGKGAHLTPEQIVRALRKSGFAAWHRLPSQGPWPEHIHAIAIGDKEMSAGAAQQVIEYRAGQNGLADHGPDDGPRVQILTWEQIRPHKRPTLWRSKARAAKYRDDVKALQRRLGITADGVWGSVTSRHLRALRRHHKLRPWRTAVAGPRVWQLVDKETR